MIRPCSPSRRVHNFPVGRIIANDRHAVARIEREVSHLILSLSLSWSTEIFITRIGVLFCDCWHILNDVVAPSEKNSGCWYGDPAPNMRSLTLKMALGSVEPVDLAIRACHEDFAYSSICEARNPQSTLFTVKLPAP